MTVENALINEKTIFEMDVVDLLKQVRNQTDPEHYMGESFDCISSAGPNAADNHYSPTPETNRQIRKNETFLLDNGGQYLDGTTDVTRTIFVGNPPEEIKNRYTRVLQGNLNLATATFPIGTYGYQSGFNSNYILLY